MLLLVSVLKNGHTKSEQLTFTAYPFNAIGSTKLIIRDYNVFIKADIYDKG